MPYAACAALGPNRLVSRRRYRYFRPLPARLFDEATLARIAASSTTVRCECPRHLVDLVSSLSAFEDYSAECEVLNIDDAALHAFLHSATAKARSLLETVLARVVEADDISLEVEA